MNDSLSSCESATQQEPLPEWVCKVKLSEDSPIQLDSWIAIIVGTKTNRVVLGEPSVSKWESVNRDTNKSGLGCKRMSLCCRSIREYFDDLMLDLLELWASSLSNPISRSLTRCIQIRVFLDHVSNLDSLTATVVVNTRSLTTGMDHVWDAVIWLWSNRMSFLVL